MDNVTTQTMLAIKAALGVTLTDWAGTQCTCTLEGQTPGPGAWTGVYCSSMGAVVGIDLSSNLFQRRLNVFLSAVSALKALKNFHLQYNWFSSSIPSSLVALSVLSTLCCCNSNSILHAGLTDPQPSFLPFLHAPSTFPSLFLPFPPLYPPTYTATHSKLNRNYLTGTVPAFKTTLKALNVASNLLSGAFPAISLTTCDARSNCLSSATNCANAAGTAQRLSSECSVCGSTDASGVLCGGGLCALDASAPAASSTPNTDGQPLLPLSCLGVPIDAAMVLALLRQAVVPGSWSSIVCDAAGKVLTLELNNNLFSGRLDSFPTLLLPVKTLKVFHVHNNYLSGAVPPSLTAFSALSELKVQGNYLTGSMPAALPASLKYMDASGNYLASLGVSFTSWAVSSPCAVQGVAEPPGAWSNVLCNSAFKPVSLLVTRKLSGQKLAGKMHSDISKLSTLTSVDFSSNLLQGRLDAFTIDFKALTSLASVSGVAVIGASYNYLYGPVPRLGTTLKTIDMQKNWLSGTFPGTGFLSCSASSNCLANTGACNTTGTTQRPLASCAVCDSPSRADPIFAGGTCAPNAASPLATSTTPTAPSPILPRFCVDVPLNAAQAAIVLSVKTDLGVTFTEWSASTLAVSPKAKDLRSFLLRGTVHADISKLTTLTTLDLRSFLLRGTVHAGISKLTTLTGLYLSSNLFNQRLDSFVAPILRTASLKEFRFSYNYLTGSLSKTGATLKILDTQANFLSGTFPAISLAACNARLNCFSDASACPNLDETAQRTVAGCNMCGSLTKKQQSLCGGGICLPIVSPSLAKVPNSATAPILPMACAAVPLDATSVAAQLSLGAALGVKDTDWRNSSKCSIEGQSANPKSWPGVWCNANGTVLSM
ncbi:unnamed protein product [Closterium sp. NIES-64]|nr:unnamed protein product [Closterium sp. NIES-64]